MRLIVLFVSAFIALCGGISLAQIPGGGVPSAYTMFYGNGELTGLPLGNYDTTGKVLVSPNSTTKPWTFPNTGVLILTEWQSLAEPAASGSYSTVNATAYNLNVYNGLTYKCSNPVLGAGLNTSGLGTNSPNCQIADGLITAGTYTHVAMLTAAIGGSSCANWTSGDLVRRVSVVNTVITAFLAATGFTGDKWILPHGGETDATLATARATLATCIRAKAAQWSSGPLGTARYFVPTESMVGNVTNSTVTGAQADAVATGCTTCRQGANVDSLTGGTNRQADGTHLTQTGAANLSALDVTVITSCKNTSCLRRRRDVRLGRHRPHRRNRIGPHVRRGPAAGNSATTSAIAGARVGRRNRRDRRSGPSSRSRVAECSLFGVYERTIDWEVPRVSAPGA